MKTVKIRGISLILILYFCFNGFSKAQIMDQDSVDNKQQNQIINIAYGTQPEWLVSGAISTVKGSELGKSFATNLANTLFGRLPGLTVVQGSGEPGADSPALYSRGINTFTKGQNILIIVDGFESSFYQLVPDEIESINLLKDASATALYGSKGANGVLLVTTKRGIADNKMRVNISSQIGFQNATHLPEFLGSYDYAKLYNEALINDRKDAIYTASDLEAYRTGSDLFFHPNVNWYDEVLRKSAPVSNYDINFRGGKEGIMYFVLFNFENREGLFKKTQDLSEFSLNAKYRKYNIRTNLDINLTKTLTTNISIGASIEDSSLPAGNTSVSIFNLMASVPANAFPVKNPNKTYGGNALYSNPFGDVMEKGLYTNNNRSFLVYVKLTQKLDMITKGLSISGAVSFNDFIEGYLNRTRTYARYSISKDPMGNTVYTKFGQSTSLVGSAAVGNRQWRDYSMQAFLNYNRVFGHHLVDAMVMAGSENSSVSGVDNNYKHNRICGRLTYSNNEKYIGEFSFAYMGSDNFAKGKRYGFFPAISLGWVTSNEEFLKGNNNLNYLKIRVSYGLVGNDNIGGQQFMFQQYYPATSPYYFGTSNSTVTGIQEGIIANPNVTWEKEKKVNIGLEAIILQRLEFSIDLFQQHRFNILAKPYNDIPQFFGMDLAYLNVGKVNNMGFESMIQYKSNPTKSLQFYIKTNVWYAKNKIVYNSESPKAFDYQYSSGHPVDQPFLLEAIGFFKDQADINSSPHQPFAIIQPGDLKYKDQNNDNNIDKNDYVPIGKSSVPEFTAGLGSGIKYKRFDLELFIQGVSGRTVYLSGNYFEAFQNNGNVSSIALGRWTTETAATATYPRLSASNNLNNFQPSSFWQRNGSFIKLRSLEIGYNFSKEVINRIKLNTARVFINGTNLLSLDHMDFTDPETIAGYPTLRIFSIGARIQF